MTFADFLGNRRVVTVLQGMLASGRLPQGLLFAGPQGVGKFTLATLFARAANCQQVPGDICGKCTSCRSLAALENLDDLVAAALAERGSASPELIPLILRPYPSVTVLVPDPDYIRVSQMRYVVREAYAMPVGGRRNFFLFDQAERLRHDYADILLKVLEEPPAHTTLILITDSPFALRPTIRSRCISLSFAPLPESDIENYLRRHRPAWKEQDRKLAAAAAAGSLGTALALDLATYRERRAEALALLRAALSRQPDPAALFTATAALAGKTPRGELDAFEESPQKIFEFSLDILYSLLTDIVCLKVETPERGLRNPDLQAELQKLGGRASWPWLNEAVGRLDRIRGGQRRNISRQLALEAWALARPSP
ncbi:MAG: hypothetical protein HYY26_03045 [Acidobacteria bacterium]|nr:hypothetical protein [Acidobacteriota bacterium]